MSGVAVTIQKYFNTLTSNFIRLSRCRFLKYIIDIIDRYYAYYVYYVYMSRCVYIIHIIDYRLSKIQLTNSLTLASHVSMTLHAGNRSVRAAC